MAETYTVGCFPAGHEENRRNLARLVRTGRGSGSFLFSGMDSLGKKMTALWYACLLNCRESQPPCGHCRSCRIILSGQHPDVFVVEKDPERKVITIEQVRKTIIDGVLYKPFEGRFRVFIVDDAHLMNDQSQNALLKVLEEPGAGVVIILVTSRPQELLGTIVSRCRRFRFFPLAKDHMAEVLKSRPQNESNPLRTAVLEAYAGGVPGRALLLASDESYWTRRKALLDLLAGLSDGHLGDILNFTGSFKGSYSDVGVLESTFEIIMGWLRDLLVMHSGMDGGGLLNSDYADALAGNAACCDAGDILEAGNLVLEVRKLVLENNLNIKMALQRILIRIRQASAISYQL